MGRGVGRAGRAVRERHQPKLGEVPRHRRVVPSDVCEEATGRAHARCGVKVAPGRQHLHRTAAVERDRDDLVHHLARLPVALLAVILTHAHEAGAARVDDTIGKAVLARRPAVLWRERDGLGVVLHPHQPLRLEVGVDDTARRVQRVRPAPVLVHPGSHVGLLRSDVNCATLGGTLRVWRVPHDHLAAALLRPTLQPV
eukprot:5091191-Prymnesium_polylepis.2